MTDLKSDTPYGTRFTCCSMILAFNDAIVGDVAKLVKNFDNVKLLRIKC